MRPRRSARGYSLVELGLVVAIALILVTTAVATSRLALESARVRRTTSELEGLTHATASALRRGLTMNALGPFAGVTSVQGQFNYLGRPLQPAVPLCFDLARSTPGVAPVCPDNGALVPAWSPIAASPVLALSTEAPASPLRAMLLGGGGQPRGFNAWCLPYVACLYGPRVEVLTCVPFDSATAAGRGPVLPNATWNQSVACPPSPLTNEATTCVLASAPSVRPTSARLSASYAPENYALPLPPAFTDLSPSP